MRIRFALSLAFVAMLAACGGAQSNRSSLAWSSSFDAVPSDATWAVAADLDARSARALEESGPQTLAALSQAAEVMGPLMQIALEPLGAPRDAGLDPLGDYALFSTAVAPIVVMRVADMDVFMDVLSESADAHGLEQTSSRVAGVDFVRFAQDEVTLDVGGVGAFAVLRVGTGQPALDVSDQAFAEVLSGDPSKRWTATDEYDVARSRVASEGELASFAFARVAPLEQAFDALVSDAGSDAMGATLPTGYRDEAQRAECREIAERMTTSMPFFSGVGVRTGRRTQVSASGLQLSTALAESYADVLGNGVAPAAAAFDDAAIYMGLGLDLAALLQTVRAPASAADCPGIAAIPGNIAQLRDRFSHEVERNLAWASGGGAFALFDLAVDGMIPMPDAALVLDSRDPVGLAGFIETQMRNGGAAVSVDETSPFTTIEYNLFFVLNVRVMQLEDRLVISVGEAAHNAASALALAERSPARFGEMRVNARTLETIVGGVLDYLRETNALPPEQLAQFESSMSANELMERSDVRVEVVGNEIRWTGEAVFREDASAE